jgi:Zn-dependent protease
MGSVASIPIRVHVTFLLLLVWLAFGTDAPSPMREAGFVILVFTCVLAHELSHALMAKRFGIQTKEITLYPFGGIASIMAQPTAKGELFISIVGPITNLIIAAGLYPFTDIGSLATKDLTTLTLVDRLFITNVAIALFNLAPFSAC